METPSVGILAVVFNLMQVGLLLLL